MLKAKENSDVKDNKIIGKLKRLFATADLKSISLVKKALAQNIDIKLISKAIIEGVEEAERSSLGNIVFQGEHKAWGNYVTFSLYYLINEASKILKPHLEPWLGKKIVIGMAKNAVHNIGKNVVSSLLGIAGFEVFDLGIDVPPEKFIEKVKEVNADVLGISSLYSNGFNNLKRTIDLLEKVGLKNKVKVIIGGSMIKDMAAEWGADAYGQCASLSINVIKQLLNIEKLPADRLGRVIIKR
ncbi:MAG: cobalamin B12-binding domain-containing protein [Candidatus Helarchaeota archaeon]